MRDAAASQVRLRWACALAVALAAFLLYLPSLRSGFVYDAEIQIASDSYIHTSTHFADILTLRVLGQDVLDRDRPAHLLSLMLDALVWGRNPLGYHLTNNLLHAANVALLFLLLVRLAAREGRNATEWKLLLAAALGAFLFAAHPALSEPVAEVSDREDLLATFFVLVGLTLADGFPGRHAFLRGGACVLALFLAAASKETGYMGPPLLALYGWLYHRNSRRAPWLALVGAAFLVVGALAVARFALEPAVSKIFTHKPGYIGGSLGGTLLIQPRIWTFLLANAAWPLHLAADYRPQNLAWITLPGALVALALVVAAQAVLAWKSRLALFGAAIFWLGLAPVSNFIPLFQPIGDRFLYLPVAGLASMLCAALLLASRRRWLFGGLSITSACALIFFGMLAFQRQAVFASPLALWTDTVKKSPASTTAFNGLGYALSDAGRYDEALQAFGRALGGSRDYADAWAGAAITLDRMGRTTDAESTLAKAIVIDPRYGKPAELLDAVAIDQKSAQALEIILARRQTP